MEKRLGFESAPWNRTIHDFETFLYTEGSYMKYKI